MNKRMNVVRAGAFAALLAACLVPLVSDGRTPRAEAKASAEAKSGEREAGGRVTEPADDPQLTALRSLQAVSKTPANLTFSNGFPRSVAARVPASGGNAVERARDYLARFRDLYAQDARMALGVRRVHARPFEGVLFQQTLDGVEVFGGQLLVSLDGREVTQTLGGLLTSRVRLDTTPSVSEAAAKEAARRASGLAAAPSTLPAKLVVYDRSLFSSRARPRTHLAWLVTLDRGPRRQVVVDAHDGRVLATLPARYDSGGSLHLLDLDVQDAEDEADSAGDLCYNVSNDPDVADEDSFDVDYEGTPDALAGWFWIKDVYAFYHDRFNYHSYDGEASLVELFIRADVPNAAWSSYCELVEVKTGWMDYEVLTHEFTHGVIGSTSDLIYETEPGALNESYADVMAMIADQERDEAAFVAPNWLFGEDRTSGMGAFRSFQNPTLFGDPDHMSGFLALGPDEEPDAEANDHGYVHSNSSIPNKAAYLMIAGGTHHNVTVQPVARDKVRFLKFLTLIQLPDSATFMDARNKEVSLAHLLLNPLPGNPQFTPQEVCSVTNAWAAVGLGPSDQDCDGQLDTFDTDDDGDFVPDSGDNCPLTPNPGQQNNLDDLVGNACDPDDDNDGILDIDDDCPFFANPKLEDGTLAPCDDFDADGVLNEDDNCLFDYNPSQYDSDGDGDGNACEVDTDGDTVPNDTDNCPVVENPTQADADGDKFGDDCDRCPTTPDPIWAYMPNGMPLQPDGDDDGIPDACDDTVNVDSSPNTVVKPDNKLHVISFDPVGDRPVRVPLDICRRGRCPEWFDRNERVELRLEDLGEGLRVMVTDEEGNVIKKAARVGGRSEISFVPAGGRRYFLTLLSQPRTGRGGGPIDTIPRQTFRLRVSTRGGF